jgi:lipoate-protein ligase A
MDVELLPRLIRIGRDRVSERGVRSAEQPVSPLSWFTSLSCEETTSRLERFFAEEFGTREGTLSQEELDAAQKLVAEKYGTSAWVNRLP